MEDVIYGYAIQKFMGINLLEIDVPDAAAPLKFRHLLEKHGLGKCFLTPSIAVWSAPDG